MKNIRTLLFMSVAAAGLFASVNAWATTDNDQNDGSRQSVDAKPYWAEGLDTKAKEYFSLERIHAVQSSSTPTENRVQPEQCDVVNGRFSAISYRCDN